MSEWERLVLEVSIWVTSWLVLEPRDEMRSPEESLWVRRQRLMGREPAVGLAAHMLHVI